MLPWGLWTRWLLPFCIGGDSRTVGALGPVFGLCWGGRPLVGAAARCSLGLLPFGCGGDLAGTPSFFYWDGHAEVIELFGVLGVQQKIQVFWVLLCLPWASLPSAFHDKHTRQRHLHTHSLTHTNKGRSCACFCFRLCLSAAVCCLFVCAFYRRVCRFFSARQLHYR